jgi:hypothetical protein
MCATCRYGNAHQTGVVPAMAVEAADLADKGSYQTRRCVLEYGFRVLQRAGSCTAVAGAANYKGSHQAAASSSRA